MESKKIIILGGARDYHVVDWYKAIKGIAPDREIILVTDTYESEGLKNVADDEVVTESLFVIDRLLFVKQSKLSNIWRNLLKLSLLPLQSYKLRKFHKKHDGNVIYHAMPMYYMMLCWFSGYSFIGTPQGSEILVRPNRSMLYKFMAKLILRSASTVTVDSESMRKGIQKISQADAKVIQNGIDLDLIDSYNKVQKNTKRDKVVSLRAMTSLYNISTILKQRNQVESSSVLQFIYPFFDDAYLNNVKTLLQEGDQMIGRLDKPAMYQLLSESFAIISIPSSDSSPRSVYEAIFLGCAVITVYNQWLDVLPVCMKSRVVVIDPESENWFDNAIKNAQEITQKSYLPSDEAINMFDENVSLRRVVDELY
ncbi:hypothetical protein QWY97_13530 [Vibrio cortegadensis]|uniref:hypothetical protein n=1 Tax=Vibrio cortegadensis TaxID=1328770 RepID=UPI0021C44785|nr:hypothetical protein [Vibrio cortegadensis]MDN3698358.1 hypothetical protein [Vibrio cortegadensis]